MGSVGDRARRAEGVRGAQHARAPDPEMGPPGFCGRCARVHAPARSLGQAGAFGGDEAGPVAEQEDGFPAKGEEGRVKVNRMGPISTLTRALCITTFVRFSRRVHEVTVAFPADFTSPTHHPGDHAYSPY